MATPETTLATDTARRHHCPICRGPMEPGRFFCSRLCGAVAELRSEMDATCCTAATWQGLDRARAAGYAAGLRRALNLLVEVAPSGNPISLAGTQPGDVLYRRAFAAHEYLIVRAVQAKARGDGGRAAVANAPAEPAGSTSPPVMRAGLQAWRVREGRVEFTGVLTEGTLEVHEWQRVGAFAEGLRFVPDNEVGHA